MRIGLTGGGPSADAIIAQAQRAESDGFHALWFASLVTGDPLVPMALAGRATTAIELGTAVLQTYPCHPLLQANRAASAANAMGRAGLTLGVGPSHAPLIRDVYGLFYDRAGSNTEDYVRILAPLLRGNDIDHDGLEWTVHSTGRMTALEHPVPVLLAALGPRLLRVAGEFADGTVLWMASARAIETHVAPKIYAAAASAGRPAPRIVAGLPVAVHDDPAEARAAAALRARAYSGLPNYERILGRGGADEPADAAIVGDEKTVRRHLEALIDAGATDIWADIFPVGDDRAASRRRTRDLLRELVS